MIVRGRGPAPKMNVDGTVDYRGVRYKLVSLNQGRDVRSKSRIGSKWLDVYAVPGSERWVMEIQPIET